MRTGKCPRCKKIKSLTKHSKLGHHLPPYEWICRECHDFEHGMGKPRVYVSPGKYQKGTKKCKKKK